MKANEIKNLIDAINDNKDLSFRDFSLQVEHAISALRPVDHEKESVFDAVSVNSDVMGLAIGALTDELKLFLEENEKDIYLTEELEIVEKHLTKRECILMFQAAKEQVEKMKNTFRAFNSMSINPENYSDSQEEKN